MPRDLSEQEAAHRLGLSYRALVWHRKTGNIEFHRVGGGRGFVRYSEAELATFRKKRG